jgi:RNA polymerase sigma-70 factor (ECF subfamily)
VSDSPTPDQAANRLLSLYSDALPQVYGYLLSRCGTATLAEDLTAETFLAAVDTVRRDHPPPLSVAWLIGVARHKLADHWRRQGREQRGLRSVGATVDERAESTDPSEQLDAVLARATLARLSPQYRLALTLRYVDDLTVSDVAEAMGRSLHATEALLVRARIAFRHAYRTSPTTHAEGKEESRG